MFEIPINEELNESVKKFTEAIVHSIKIKNKLIDVEVNYDEASCADGSQKALKSSISTKYGLVHIYPDFKKNCAQASIINRGLFHSMILEGFDEQVINDSKIFGSPFIYSEDKVNTLGHYLTKDFGMQHQKGWQETSEQL